MKSDYKPNWEKVKIKRAEKHAEYVKQIPFSDFTVFETVLKSIPNHSNIQSANSSTIRYLQLFDLNKTLKVFCKNSWFSTRRIIKRTVLNSAFLFC